MFHQATLLALPGEARGPSTPLPSYSPTVEFRLSYVEPPVHVSDINRISLYSVRTFMIGDLSITESVYEIAADCDLQDNVDQGSQTSSAVTEIFNPQIEGNHRDLVNESLLMPVELFETEGDVSFRINSVIEILGGMVVNEQYDPQQSSNRADDDITPQSARGDLTTRCSSTLARGDYGVEDPRLLLDQIRRADTPLPGYSNQENDTHSGSDTESEVWE